MTDLRIGHGYDVHRLTEGRKLILGGVEIPYEKGLLGHSDADVLVHAVMDARRVLRSGVPVTAPSSATVLMVSFTGTAGAT